jgi:hypothetical protein
MACDGTRRAACRVMNPDKPTDDGNQGEGDRNSARRYDGHVREFVAGGQVEPAAREAEAYVERQPGDAVRAERQAKHGPQPTKVPIEELVAKGRTFVDRVQSFAHRVVDRLGRRSRH